MEFGNIIMSHKYSVLPRDSGYIPLHRVWIVTAAELVQLDQPNHQSYHCG